MCVCVCMCVCIDRSGKGIISLSDFCDGLLVWIEEYKQSQSVSYNQNNEGLSVTTAATSRPTSPFGLHTSPASLHNSTGGGHHHHLHHHHHPQQHQHRKRSRRNSGLVVQNRSCYGQDVVSPTLTTATTPTTHTSALRLFPLPSYIVLMSIRMYACMCTWLCTWLCMAVYVAMCMPLVCVVMYESCLCGYIWLCMTMYGWLCMAMYGYVWLCMAMYMALFSCVYALYTGYV